MASGGKRIGAGRKSTGRKPQSFYINDIEKAYLDKMLKAVRFVEHKRAAPIEVKNNTMFYDLISAFNVLHDFYDKDVK